MAESGEKRYRKEILLPQVVKREDISMSYHNGMLEIYCKTQDQDQEAKRE
jgi:HSP20 family molecular chaperone IbpA